MAEKQEKVFEEAEIVGGSGDAHSQTRTAQEKQSMSNEDLFDSFAQHSFKDIRRRLIIASLPSLVVGLVVFLVLLTLLGLLIFWLLPVIFVLVAGIVLFGAFSRLLAYLAQRIT